MNLIIISHRRSGTHLTIDAILNNFKNFDNSQNGHYTLSFSDERKEIAAFENQIKNNNRIIKVHELPDFQSYNLTDEELAFYKNFFEKTPKIYVYRHCCDVLISLYHYLQKFRDDVKAMSLKDFIQTNHDFDPLPEPMNRSQFWAYHINSWTKHLQNSQNTLFVRYEDWISNYEQTLNRIADFLQLPLPKKITDIRIKNQTTEKAAIARMFARMKKIWLEITGKKITAVLPRKGTTGDYKKHFDKEMLSLIHPSALETLKKLNYDL